MNINNKIKQLILDKHLSPSSFADEIGVLRSSISHILSGRNRPGLDIIQKIVRRFPDVQYEWLLTDEENGEEMLDAEPAIRLSARNVAAPTSGTRKIIPTEPRRRAETPVSKTVVPEPTAPVATPIVSSTESTIEKILIFYSDGTFKEFKQA